MEYKQNIYTGESKMVNMQKQEGQGIRLESGERRTVFGRESELHDRRKSEREYVKNEQPYRNGLTR
jgi:hypothetical protein